MDLGKTIQAISFMMCLGHEKLSSKLAFGHCTQEHPSWLGTGRFIAYSLCVCVSLLFLYPDSNSCTIHCLGPVTM
jgi:hypothetical protein